MFTYIRKAQYHETDQMAIIHHANYVKWMEEARIEFLNSIGCGYETIEKAGILSPVAGISVDYKKPVQFADEVEIRLSIHKYNGIILELDYEFYNRTKDEICTKASSKHCFVKAEQIISLKKEMPELDQKIHTLMDGQEN